MGEMMRVVETRDGEQKAYLDTLAMLEEAVLELSPLGVIQRASPGWDKLVRRDKTVGTNIEHFLHSEDVDALRAQYEVMQQGIKNQVSLRLRLITELPDQHRWVECRLVSHLECTLARWR